MSGHSKWSTIKRKKAAIDSKRGKLFTKVVREITSATRLGGGDPDGNPRLRLAIDKARDLNMPNDNIKRAIQKGQGADAGDAFEDILFEAYAPFGVALLIETLTDNRNRTVPSLRSALTKAGGSLATKGAVSYLFNQKGIFIFEPGVSEEQVVDIATSNGADDVDLKDDGSIEVDCDPSHFHGLNEALEKAKLKPSNASLEMIPTVSVPLTLEQAQKIMALIEKLEDDDDVQAVHSNAEFPDEAMN